MKRRKAVCLLSGGLDSTTALYVALRDGYEVHALTLHYGQLHSREIDCARSICCDLKVPHDVVPIALPWGGSSLLDQNMPLPQNRSEEQISRKIPSTYVPARNTIFLSFAMSLAEVNGAEAIFIGANAIVASRNGEGAVID